MTCTLNIYFFISQDPRCSVDGKGWIGYYIIPINNDAPYYYTWYKNNSPLSGYINKPIQAYQVVYLPLTMNDEYQFVATGNGCTKWANKGKIIGGCTQNCDFNFNFTILQQPTCNNGGIGSINYTFNSNGDSNPPYCYIWRRYGVDGIVDLASTNVTCFNINDGDTTPALELKANYVYRFGIRGVDGCIDWANSWVCFITYLWKSVI